MSLPAILSTDLIQTAQDGSGTTFAWKAIPYASLYQINLDGVKLRTVTGLTTKITTAEAAPGSHFIGVQPIAGPTAATRKTFTVPSIGGLSTPTLSVSWNAAVRLSCTAVTGATGFNWFRNNVKIGSTKGTNFFDSGANWGNIMSPGVLYSYQVQATSATNSSAMSVAQTITTPNPLSTMGALTSQSQVNAASATATFWGGTVTGSQIVLKQGQKWTNGKVTGTVTTTTNSGNAPGALEVATGGSSPPTSVLVNCVVSVDNAAFAALYFHGANYTDHYEVLGGRYTGAGALGIGASRSTCTVRLVEMDRNGATGSCGVEAGGIKWVGDATIDECYAHDNHCKGIWSDLWGNGTVTNCRSENNQGEGYFIEESHDVVLDGCIAIGNGYYGGIQGNPSPTWWFLGGITATSSVNVEVKNCTLSDNFNGITGIQQNRTDSPNPTSHCLNGFNVHDNIIHGSSRAGALNRVGIGADSGGQTYGASYCGSSNCADASRNNVFANNTIDQNAYWAGDTT